MNIFAMTMIPIILSMRILALLSSLTILRGTILRLPCLKYADFNVFYIDKALRGHLIRRDSDLSDAQCMIKCIEHSKCRSYNINKDLRLCELNAKAVDAGDIGIQLTDEPGWVYKSTDYNNLLAGETCKSLKPCEAGILCRDTCTAPYYECIYCDENHNGLHCDKPIGSNWCSENSCIHGTCINKTSGYECNCLEGYSGKKCDTEIDECNSLPCFNGGTCRNIVGGFQCTCLPAYTGVHCEMDMDECLSSPCQNSGTCHNLIGEYKCTCAVGYAGTRCETEINECASSPCQNTASCNDLIGRYSCTCAVGYIGARCETEINECASSPCQNSASCNDLIGRYSCTCGVGYIGARCETEINECTSSPCQNSASCNDLIGRYSCTCAVGYTGARCETDIDECQSSPCFNGATCRNLIGRFECSCLPVNYGIYCEKGYIGCFKDEEDRALPHLQEIHVSSGDLTRQCKDKCRSLSYSYAGLQYYEQCFCGNNYPKYTRLQESECNAACKDSTGMMCGGTWRNSVYLL